MDEAGVAEMLRRFADAARPGVLLDIDGTLAPIVARPDDARVAPDVREAVAALVPRMTLVAVISGRPSEEAAVLVAVPGVEVLGSYGLGDLAGIPAPVLV